MAGQWTLLPILHLVRLLVRPESLRLRQAQEEGALLLRRYTGFISSKPPAFCSRICVQGPRPMTTHFAVREYRLSFVPWPCQFDFKSSNVVRHVQRLYQTTLQISFKVLSCRCVHLASCAVNGAQALARQYAASDKKHSCRHGVSQMSAARAHTPKHKEAHARTDSCTHTYTQTLVCV